MAKIETSQRRLAVGLKPITDKVKLIVPADAVDAYSAHDYWGKFEIEEIEEFFYESLDEDDD